jgi:cell division transport system ATP-binding protein
VSKEMDKETIVNIENAKIVNSKITILNEVNLKLESGEFVYLIGKTGSGKSSLLKTLYGELKLNSGKGIVCGFDLEKLKKKEIPFLRRKLGIVFQDFELLMDRTVHDNLHFVLRATGWKDKKKMDARIKEVLEHVGLGAKGYKMPHELSGGEQQRVVISRALLNNPTLLLADEPTGNLDPETSQNILKLLQEIASEGTAIIMATHDYSVMEQFPARTIRCEDQRVKEIAKSS